MAEVKEPESIADYSCHTVIIATIIAKLKGADPAGAAFIAI